MFVRQMYTGKSTYIVGTKLRIRKVRLESSRDGWTVVRNGQNYLRIAKIRMSNGRKQNFVREKVRRTSVSHDKVYTA